LCRQLEAAGCSYLTVHARTVNERHEPVHIDLLKQVIESTNSQRMPMVANGDLFTLNDCYRVCNETKARGVMCARGLLENPAMFSGESTTPIECIERWIDICLKYGTKFDYFKKVLVQMLNNVMSKNEKRYFYTLSSTASTIDYLKNNIFNLK
jgi:tRNA-dihydrouridine synthase 4